MTKGISEVDPVLDALGGTGRYQFLQFFLIKIACLSTTFQLLNIVFVGRGIPQTCSRPDNISDIFDLINTDKFSMNTSVVEFDKCNIRVKNNVSGTAETTSLDCIYGYTYEERKDLSLMSDMDVVCDKASLKGLGLTLLILGQGLGASFFPIFSDRYGRRPVHLISHFLMLCLGIAVAFSPSYVVFLILRIILGAAQQGVVMTRTTYTIEMFPARHRKISGFLSSLAYSGATMLIALIGYLTRDLPWRTVQLVYSSVSFCVFVQYLSFGLGTCSSFSRIGGMLAPFANVIAEYVPWAPGTIFGGCCILVSILVNILPETMGRELPQTLEDLEGWYKKKDYKESKDFSAQRKKLDIDVQ